MDNDASLKDWCNYFDRIKDLYPHGIPETLILDNVVKTEEAGQSNKLPETTLSEDPVIVRFGKRHASVVFLRVVGKQQVQIDPYDGEPGILLTAIVDKGLKLTPEDVSIIQVSNGTLFSHTGKFALARSVLAKDLDRDSKALVIALGDKSAALLAGQYEFQPNDFIGRWEEFGGKKVIGTYELNQIMTDLKLKRSFWNHLQQFIAEYHRS